LVLVFPKSLVAGYLDFGRVDQCVSCVFALDAVIWHYLHLGTQSQAL
jgi:hypothetical protein